MVALVDGVVGQWWCRKAVRREFREVGVAGSAESRRGGVREELGNGGWGALRRNRLVGASPSCRRAGVPPASGVERNQGCGRKGGLRRRRWRGRLASVASRERAKRPGRPRAGHDGFRNRQFGEAPPRDGPPYFPRLFSTRSFLNWIRAASLLAALASRSAKPAAMVSKDRWRHSKYWSKCVIVSGDKPRSRAEATTRSRGRGDTRGLPRQLCRDGRGADRRIGEFVERTAPGFEGARFLGDQ
jgi:hypothetical protein